MTLNFSRVALGMSIGLLGILGFFVFIVNPLLFPPVIPWGTTMGCGYTASYGVRWDLIIVPFLLAIGAYLLITGMDSSEPEPEADKKKYCPCCGKKIKEQP